MTAIDCRSVGRIAGAAKLAPRKRSVGTIDCRILDQSPKNCEGRRLRRRLRKEERARGRRQRAAVEGERLLRPSERRV
eukprot:1805989-Pleurochrysis_carterae.AAC.1